MAIESAVGTKLAATFAPFAVQAVNSLFNIDISDVFSSQTVELTAPTAGEVSKEYAPIKSLGTNPVAPNMEDAWKGNDTNADLRDDSPFMKATRAVTIEYADAQNMTQAQKDAFVKDFMDKVYSHKQDFINAYSDKSGKFDNGAVKDVFLENGKFIMGNGDFTAQRVDLQLTGPHQAVEYTHTYTDPATGKQVEAKIKFADACINPIMDEAPKPAVMQAVATPAPVVEKGCVILPPTWENTIIEGPDGRPMNLPVVTRYGTPEDIWVDDGDGKIWEYKGDPTDRNVHERELTLDSGDKIAQGIPVEQVKHDVKVLQDAGYKGDFVVYRLIDCDGRETVVCWNIKKECWGVFYDNTWHPAGQTGVDRPIIDTRSELEDYKKENAYKKRIR